MGRFEILTARQELGFRPSTAVRANIDTRTGAGAVGAAIGQGLTQLIGQGIQTAGREKTRREAIEAKRQQMTDANNAVLAEKLRDTADSEYEAFRATNPQETWEAFRQKQTASVGQEVTKLNFSADALESQRVKSEAYSEVETARALTDSTLQLRKDTIETQTEAMVDAFRTGGARDQLDAATRYRDNAANMGKDKVEALNDIKAAREAGRKLRKQDTIDAWQDRIAETPQVVEDELNAELEARKTDKGIIPILASSDIQSLISLANAREVQMLADTQAERNRIEKEEENRLYDGLADGTSNVTDVTKSKLISAAAKRRLVNDEENFAQRDVDKNWPLTNDDVTVQRLESLLTSLESGTIDRSQFNRETNAAAVDGRLTKEERDRFRSLAKKGGRDAIDSAVKVSTDQIRNALLSRLTDRDARFIVRSQAGTLSPAEQREAGNNAFLLQVNKHQLTLIQSELDRALRLTGKDVVSGVEATAMASKIWEQFRQKSLGEKIGDFKEFSGQRIPKPPNFPSSRWDALDSQGRAAVVEAIDRGETTENILKIIGE